MEAAIPFIFVHKGDSFYLQYTFNQLKKTNPQSDIYLIGDESNRKYTRIGIKHINMNDYSVTANEFEKIYVHLSSNKGFVEKICFQRWMYIRDFVNEFNIQGPFCCMDSDVLVYENISDYYYRYCADYDVTLHGSYGPGCNVFKNVQILNGLVDNIFMYYSTPELLEKLQDRYYREKKNVTDMLMIDAYVKEKSVKSYDLLKIVDNMTFDSHIAKTSDDRFLLDGKCKKVKYENNHMYCYRTSDNSLVLMYMLHIQGYFKQYMYRYYHGNRKAVEPRIIAMMRTLVLSIKRKIANLR